MLRNPIRFRNAPRNCFVDRFLTAKMDKFAKHTMIWMLMFEHYSFQETLLRMPNKFLPISILKKMGYCVSLACNGLTLDFLWLVYINQYQYIQYSGIGILTTYAMQRYFPI